MQYGLTLPFNNWQPISECSVAGSAFAGTSKEYVLQRAFVEFEAELIMHILSSAHLFAENEEEAFAKTPVDIYLELSRALAERGCMGIAQALSSFLSSKGGFESHGGESLKRIGQLPQPYSSDDYRLQ
jgi:hypothetical protein